MRHHNYFVYFVTNPFKTVLYIGVTNDLSGRLTEHFLNQGKPETFAGKFHCHNLLHYEHFPDIRFAITREKELKGWTRKKKMDLIKAENPQLIFMNKEVCGIWPPETEQR
jgi:putative endonuclease